MNVMAMFNIVKDGVITDFRYQSSMQVIHANYVNVTYTSTSTFTNYSGDLNLYSSWLNTTTPASYPFTTTICT